MRKVQLVLGLLSVLGCGAVAEEPGESEAAEEPAPKGAGVLDPALLDPEGVVLRGTEIPVRGVPGLPRFRFDFLELLNFDAARVERQWPGGVLHGERSDASVTLIDSQFTGGYLMLASVCPAAACDLQSFAFVSSAPLPEERVSHDLFVSIALEFVAATPGAEFVLDLFKGHYESLVKIRFAGGGDVFAEAGSQRVLLGQAPQGPGPQGRQVRISVLNRPSSGSLTIRSNFGAPQNLEAVSLLNAGQITIGARTMANQSSAVSYAAITKLTIDTQNVIRY